MCFRIHTARIIIIIPTTTLFTLVTCTEKECRGVSTEDLARLLSVGYEMKMLSFIITQQQATLSYILDMRRNYNSGGFRGNFKNQVFKKAKKSFFPKI